MILKRQLCKILMLLYLCKPLIINTQIINLQKFDELNWTSHLPMNNILGILSSANKIVSYTSNQIAIHNEFASEINYINKSNFLNNHDITLVTSLSDTSIILFVGYKDGSFDIIENGASTLYSGIKNNKTIQNAKKVFNQCLNYNGQLIILMDYGITIFNLNTRAFEESLLTDFKLKAGEMIGKDVYVASENRVYQLSTDDLSQLNQTSYLKILIDVPYQSKATKLITCNSKLLSIYDHNIFVIDSAIQSVIEMENDYLITQGYNSNQKCVLINAQGQLFQFVEEGNQINEFYKLDYQPQIVYTANNASYFTTKNNKFFRQVPHTNAEELILSVIPNQVIDMISYSDTLIAITNTTDHTLFIYDQFTWKKKVLDIPISAKSCIMQQIIQDQKEKNVFWITVDCGLLKWNQSTNIVDYFGENNVNNLLMTTGDNYRAIAQQKNGSIIITNPDPSHAALILDSKGNWSSISAPNQGEFIGIFVDKLDNLWFNTKVGGIQGLYVIRINNFQQNIKDNQSIFLSTFNVKLPNEIINTLHQDENEVIHVGHKKGHYALDCIETIFDDPCQPYKIVVRQDSILQYLLAEEDIQYITQDAGNQKWIATGSGVFIQNSDFTQPIGVITRDNSPLNFNLIKKISIDHSSGNIYILDIENIYQLNTNYIKSQDDISDDSIFIYPNPVKPHWYQPITISNVQNNARVVITDALGQPVREFTSVGSTTTWDQKNINGQFVSAGIYIILSYRSAKSIAQKTLLKNIITIIR